MKTRHVLIWVAGLINQVLLYSYESCVLGTRPSISARELQKKFSLDHVSRCPRVQPSSWKTSIFFVPVCCGLEGLIHEGPVFYVTKAPHTRHIKKHGHWREGTRLSYRLLPSFHGRLLNLLLTISGLESRLKLRECREQRKKGYSRARE